MTTFQQPKSVEEALQRKRMISDDVTRFQTALKDETPRADDGHLITDRRERSEFRQNLKHLLASRYEETRFLKDWLRLNATRKPSEWDMLGRAYRILSMLEEQGVALGEEGSGLLSDLEMHVPHIHLMGSRTEENSAA
jgi:hypothetical protein